MRPRIGPALFAVHFAARSATADENFDTMLDRIRRIAYEEFEIKHITIQLETSAANCTEDHHVDHLMATAGS